MIQVMFWAAIGAGVGLMIFLVATEKYWLFSTCAGLVTGGYCHENLGVATWLSAVIAVTTFILLGWIMDVITRNDY